MKTKVKGCVECGQVSAIHWNRSFCSDCYAALLKEKVREEK